MKTIFGTYVISQHVHSDEFKKELAEANEMDIEDISDEWLWDDEQRIFEQEIAYLNEEFGAFIERFEKRYKTSIANIVFIGNRSSNYGWIGGSGHKVGRETGRSMDLSNVVGNCDNVEFEITDDKKLRLITYDHDGANYMEAILVTESEQSIADERYDDIRIFLDEKGKLSTRLDKAFLHAFAYEGQEVA